MDPGRLGRVVIDLPLSDVRRLLVVGAHADDIEIGCGGTILHLTRSRPDIEVTWVVMAAGGVRADEARASARLFLGSEDATVLVHPFRDGFLPYNGAEVKEAFEQLKARVDPDLILTHTRADLHQDHRLVSELTWNTFRDHLILEFEIPKYDGDLGTPNVFVPIPEPIAREKCRLLAEAFPSQAGRHWFDDDLFLGLMRLRGMEAPSPSRYAEAFHGRKLTLRVDR